MSSTRGTNTQQEALQGMLSEIAQIKTYPDADIEWLLGLETQILQKVREPAAAAMQNSDLGGMQPSPSQGMSPDAMGGMAPSPAGPPGVAGLRQSPGAPNPDELRRLLTTGQ